MNITPTAPAQKTKEQNGSNNPIAAPTGTDYPKASFAGVLNAITGAIKVNNMLKP